MYQLFHYINFRILQQRIIVFPKIRTRSRNLFPIFSLHHCTCDRTRHEEKWKHRRGKVDIHKRRSFSRPSDIRECRARSLNLVTIKYTIVLS